jgi:hypothetical protein
MADVAGGAEGWDSRDGTFGERGSPLVMGKQAKNNGGAVNENDV